jgi:hypothetical protein
MGFYQKYIIHVDSKLYCGSKNYLISHTWKEKHSSGILGVDLSIAILIVVHSLVALVICKKEMTDNIRFNRMQGKYNYTGCVCNLRGAHLKHMPFYKNISGLLHAYPNKFTLDHLHQHQWVQVDFLSPALDAFKAINNH